MSRRERPRPRPSIREPRFVPRQVPQERPRADAPRHRPGQSAASNTQPVLPQQVSVALVLLRVFLGVTFVYAGLDKLIDPTFLRSSGPGSIAAQLEAFSRVSPIAILIQIFAQPFPVLIGLTIAIAEIAIGLGALTGLLFRLSAAGGAALSIMFWLTASWATKPYYYGPDLPYAAGWLTLAIAGHGGRFVLDGWFATAAYGLDDAYSGEESIDRRRVLQAAVLGLGAVVLAGLGGTLGSAIFGRPTGGSGLADAPSPTQGGQGDQSASVAPSAGSGAGPSGAQSAGPGTNQAPAATPSGVLIATVANLTRRGAIEFQDPQTGDPAVLVKLPDGKAVAFDAVCTHAGCTVQFDSGSGFLICPCHGATFDPTHAAAVLAGPTDQPLARLPIHVDSATGAITLQA